MDRLLTVAVEDVLSGKFLIRAAAARHGISREIVQPTPNSPQQFESLAAFIQSIPVLKIQFHVSAWCNIKKVTIDFY